PDYKCQRLDLGLRVATRVHHVATPVRVRFGKWARLIGHGPAGLMEVEKAYQRERRVLIAAQGAAALTAMRGLSAPVRRRFTSSLSRARAWDDAPLERLHLVVETI